MAGNKVILLACGSFNPPTHMHLRMFEIARDYLHRMGTEVLFGIISPVHDAYGKRDLVPASHRLAMTRIALQETDWIKLSDWECNQTGHTRTMLVLRHHQNQINAIINNKLNDNINEQDVSWFPNIFHNMLTNVQNVQVKLLCGADLLESFGTPGLWLEEDIESIIKNHGLVVISRENSNPGKFIYMSDILTKYMRNVTIVTEWIRNEVSSTKIRRALSRQESVKYLLSDKVIEYITKNELYGSKRTIEAIPFEIDIVEETMDTTNANRRVSSRLRAELDKCRMMRQKKSPKMLILKRNLTPQRKGYYDETKKHRFSPYGGV